MQHNKQWAGELSALAAVLAKSSLEKSIKWGAEVFTYEGKNVVSYGGFRGYFSLWFFNGVFLEDRYKVLVSAQGGKTKSLRQWRFTSIDQIDEKKILEYVAEAVEVEKRGLKIKPEKFTPAPVPPLLAGALANDPELQAAFSRLTPGRQKEYIAYLDEARQDATKLKRLEKIKPVILAGRGLNDKYK